jgi:hypothetical protein
MMAAFWRTEGTYINATSADHRAAKMRAAGYETRIVRRGDKYEVQIGSNRTKDLRTKE